MAHIKLMISDFDGTLVDTFEANYKAYKKAFGEYNINLSREKYSACFGYRFDEFMKYMNINDENIKNGIRKLKSEYYPLFFNDLTINQPLINILRSFKNSGGLTAVASTASHKNITNALDYIHAKDAFSLILTGEDVNIGKPNPEIYNTILKKLEISPEEAIVFEDSIVGIQAASAAKISYIKITKDFFHENIS